MDAIPAAADLRLTRYFGLTPGFSVGLQADHDPMAGRRELGADLEAVRPRVASAEEAIREGRAVPMRKPPQGSSATPEASTRRGRHRTA